MELSYFGNLKWSQITRDERFFCAELYFFYKRQAERLVELMFRTGTVACLCEEDINQKWSLEYEVCFFRDVVFHLNKSRKQDKLSVREFSGKRTFDLCLFSEHKIIVIEAKVQQMFDHKQMKDFENDQYWLDKLRVHAALPEAHLVGLASDIYFRNVAKYGKEGIPTLFANNYFTWKDVFTDSKEELFWSANELYKK
jgi:hypothetical protein